MDRYGKQFCVCLVHEDISTERTDKAYLLDHYRPRHTTHVLIALFRCALDSYSLFPGINYTVWLRAIVFVTVVPHGHSFKAV